MAGRILAQLSHDVGHGGAGTVDGQLEITIGHVIQALVHRNDAQVDDQAGAGGLNLGLDKGRNVLMRFSIVAGQLEFEGLHTQFLLGSLPVFERLGLIAGPEVGTGGVELGAVRTKEAIGVVAIVLGHGAIGKDVLGQRITIDGETDRIEQVLVLQGRVLKVGHDIAAGRGGSGKESFAAFVKRNLVGADGNEVHGTAFKGHDRGLIVLDYLIFHRIKVDFIGIGMIRILRQSPGEVAGGPVLELEGAIGEQIVAGERILIAAAFHKLLIQGAQRSKRKDIHPASCKAWSVRQPASCHPSPSHPAWKYQPYRR